MTNSEMLLVTHASKSPYELVPIVIIILLFLFVLRHKRR